MRNPLLSATLALILLALASPGTQAKPGVDHPLLEAKSAFEAGSLPRLAQAQRRLAGDPLRVWADYWATRLTVVQDPFGSGTPAQISRFIQGAGAHPTTKLILKDWGHAALRKGPWSQVAPVVEQIRPLPESPALACAQARLLLEKQQIPLAQAVPLIRGNEDREGCLYLLEAVHQRMPLPAQALQTYARWAAGSGDLEAAQRIWQLAPSEQNWLDRERSLLTLLARSQSNSILVASQFDRGQFRLNDEQNAYAKGVLAGRLFIRSDPRAWTYLQDALAKDETLLSHLPTPSLEAFARLSLRRGDWARLQRILSALPPAVQAEEHWTYWQAWLAQQRGDTTEARRLWESIPAGWGFYQQLASAALSRPGPIGRREAELNPEILRSREQLKAQGGLQRALTLSALGLRAESALEWRAVIEDQPDAVILAAAELAYAQGHYDRAIHAAIRTQSAHDLSLRYPKPYQQTIDRYAAERSLSAHWVFGLIRQESRFLAAARSPVGAAGLMQLMPRTAKSLAREERLHSFRPASVTEPDLNVRLGTRYLRSLLDQFDGSWVLATAAYNAGPARSRLWRTSLVREIPGAAFAESIPFAETRDYVKIVLANAAAYQSPAKPESLMPYLGPLSPR